MKLGNKISLIQYRTYPELKMDADNESLIKGYTYLFYMREIYTKTINDVIWLSPRLQVSDGKEMGMVFRTVI